MSYPGGKAGAGVYQTIINLMPPHELYLEPFVGGGAILLRKRPARASIVIDADADVAARWQRCAGQGRFVDLTAIHGDARSLIAKLDVDRASTLIYADPPYVHSTRRDASRQIYRHEFTDQDHRDLLSLLTAMHAARVIVSGYRSPIYDRALSHWQRIAFKAQTRGGPAIESVWINFAPPRALHDYSYLGRDFRERERIKRKRDRWRRRLAAMPELERAAIREALELASARAAVVDVRSSSPGMARGSAIGAIAANDEPGRRRRASLPPAVLERPRR